METYIWKVVLVMIKKYWKDYWELCSLAYLVIYRDEVKNKINKIKNKFHKEEEA